MNAPPQDPRLKAVSLAGRWQRLVQSHLPLRGGPCACLLGVGNIAVADFEQDLMDFLHARYNGGGKMDRHFVRAGRNQDAAGSLAGLLQSIAQDPQPDADADRLLEGLESSLRSLESSH
ncbi:MAG: hypothetical protein QHC78_05750 [Pigmentiphaga sp.]|uniref:hypothetical protein n=1 Tax=Pigmentiphaga sp. TaxID=1977564 RepID=UPI0029BD0A59|nr:hypothetical protein [Pigmentiphaga sp.]MDX3905177.1 hypothetical protein [Pigmentiphaga sp.]